MRQWIRRRSQLLPRIAGATSSRIVARDAHVHSQPPSEDLITAQREQLIRIGKLLNVEQPSDWYRIKRSEIIQKMGKNKSLMRRRHTMMDAVKLIYPDFAWDPSKFVPDTPAANAYWSNPDAQRRHLRIIEQYLGIGELSGWYTVTRDMVRSVPKGWRLLKHYFSVERMVMTLYPDYPWQPLEFVRDIKGNRPRGYWANERNILKALEGAETKLGITQAEDWLSVHLSDLKELGLPLSRAALTKSLALKYPHHDWRRFYLLKGKYAMQKKLERVVRSLFKNTDIIVNSRTEAGLLYNNVGEYLELDIYLPSLQLAFEYQERHHYLSAPTTYRPVKETEERDKRKKELAREKTITLIIVPFWWDGQVNSLVASIKEARPDLLKDVQTTASPIRSDTIPEHLLRKGIINIEGIGEPSTACFLTNSRHIPTNWWILEKYDGVRGFWNPLTRSFYSRLGNKLDLPPEIVKEMPADIFLDGELWFGRENFQEAMKIAHRVESNEIDWSQFKYMVFDQPNVDSSYSERYSSLLKRFGQGECKYIEVAPREVCADMNHLERFFQDVIDKGGEGIILRDPLAPHQPGRAPGYLKHKKFRDAEARIVKPVGIAQWECELPNGVHFVASAGTTKFAERWNPKEGDIVSFKHVGYLLKTKKPKFPSLYRIRPDLTWESVVENWTEHSSRSTSIASSFSPLRINNQSRPRGYWRDIENRKRFFIDYATQRGFDPFDPQRWSLVPPFQVYANKGNGLLKRYKFNLLKALQATFPELVFDFPEGRKRVPMRVTDPAAQAKEGRAFFDAFAKENGFDPLGIDNWYSLKLSLLAAKKGGIGIKVQYKGFKRALQITYPELAFTKWETSSQ